MTFTEKINGDDFQYIYTNFEPYGAHRFVPCFDQPDLKASASFIITAPDDWKAAGNELEAEATRISPQKYLKNAKVSDKSLLSKFLSKAKSNTIVIAFNPTKTISSYLYCIIAGKYHVHVVPKEKLYKDIPMKLYCI